MIGLTIASAPAGAAECIEYGIESDVTAASSTASPVRATVNQLFVLRREGCRSNPFEISFRFPGDLNAQGVPGNLEVLSNSCDARNLGINWARVNLATTGTVVTLDGTTRNTFELDYTASFLLPSPNVLVVPGPNLFGNCPSNLQSFCRNLPGAPGLQTTFVVPRLGKGWFVLSQDLSAIQGGYELAGSSVDNPNISGTHEGQFVGQARQTYVCP